MRSFCITGQSNYALAVILDTLHARYGPEQVQVDIVANIPPGQNESLAFPFACPGIETREFYYTEWRQAQYDGYFAGSIGRSRRAIVSFFEAQFGLLPDLYRPLIHPAAVCSPTVAIGHGTHISPLSVVAPYAILGQFVVINRHVSIGHHTMLGNFVTVNPGATIAGCCRLEDGVTVGAGATVLDKITIGAGSIIGAGSVVTKPVPAGVVAYGAPAKVIRNISESG
jgi:sugar O-acyltransferase (sialic acid O-acetyltransferase NeuD family)